MSRGGITLRDFLIRSRLELILLHGSIFDGCLHFVVEIAQFVGVSDAKLGKLDVALLTRVDIVPNFCYVLAGERDSHAFNGRNKVRFFDFALASFVHEAENFGHVSVLVLHSG